LVDIFKGDNSVIESIVKMLENKEYANRLAVNAKQRVQANFKWESQVGVLERWM